jgi:hypothetical protein
MEERQVELWKDMENRKKKSKLNSEKIWKMWKKVDWIVKWYGKHGRTKGRIVIRYEKYGKK